MIIAIIILYDCTICWFRHQDSNIEMRKNTTLKIWKYRQ